MKRLDAHLMHIQRKHVPGPNKILSEQRHHLMEMSHHHNPKWAKRLNRFIGKKIV